MGIKITVKNKSNNDILNNGINIIFKGLEEDLKDSECIIHKSESFGTLIINSENGKIEYGEFCCDKFKPNL